MNSLTVPVATGDQRTYPVVAQKQGLAVLDCGDHYSVTHVASGRTPGPALFIEREIALEVFDALLGLAVDWELPLIELHSSRWFMECGVGQIHEIVNNGIDRDYELNPQSYEEIEEKPNDRP